MTRGVTGVTGVSLKWYRGVPVCYLRKEHRAEHCKAGTEHGNPARDGGVGVLPVL
jgi:hypothetical protein